MGNKKSKLVNTGKPFSYNSRGKGQLPSEPQPKYGLAAIPRYKPDPVEAERKRRDVDKIVDVIKAFDYKAFCDLLKTDIFIHHWQVFEEALQRDLSINLESEGITPDMPLYTLRLMEHGYQIAERKLENIGHRVYINKRRFMVLKKYIIEHYLSGVKSLQYLCRETLKKAYVYNYFSFVMDLNYPEKLKDYLLLVS